jgi:hypothetical protein
MEPLSFDERVYKQHGHMVIEKVRLQDAGDYVCLIKNDVGSKTVEASLAVFSE